ncbi:acyltransferase family protein [Streptomyces sp. NPDC101160]|uniref:acyltransferase family protein n=1 Tax=Streptomyces sp. NPDC101160 TaxID=3366118 RepID=UPI00380922FA
MSTTLRQRPTSITVPAAGPARTERASGLPARLPGLTGLRFVAALLVFVYHATYVPVFADGGVQQTYAFLAGKAGNLGVSFFFVLSGFVLTWAARADDSAPRFWRRRFFKIFPSHVLVFALALALLPLSGMPLKPVEALANLFLVQSWLPDSDFMIYAVNGVTWSLSVELAFYAAFPLLLRLIRAIRPERLWVWALAVVAAVVAVPVVTSATLDGPPNMMVPGVSWAQLWTGYFAPPVRALEFVAGMLAARLVLEGRWKLRIGVVPASLLVAAAYAAALFVPVVYGFAAVFTVPLMVLIAAVAQRDAQGRYGLLGSRPMQWLGDASYNVFLLNLLVLLNLHPVLGSPTLSTGAAILYHLGTLALTVVLARLIYVLVERPAMRRWS